MPFLRVLVIKVNAIARLEFELAYCNIAVQYVRNYAMETPPNQINVDIEINQISTSNNPQGVDVPLNK